MGKIEQGGVWEATLVGMWGERESANYFLTHLNPGVPTLCMCLAGMERSREMALYLRENGYELHPRHFMGDRVNHSLVNGCSLRVVSRLERPVVQAVVLLNFQDSYSVEIFREYVPYLNDASNQRVFLINGTEAAVCDWLLNDGLVSARYATLQVGKLPGSVSWN